MSQKNLDIVMIYAYADKSYSDLRDNWCDFLQYLVPTLFQIDAQDFEDAMDEASSKSADELCEAFPEKPTRGQVVREISADIAETIQMGREFGLAAFHSGDMHTKVYALSRQSKFKGDVQTRWLIQFAKVQRDPDFEQVYTLWKSLIDTVFFDEEAESDDKQTA